MTAPRAVLFDLDNTLVDRGRSIMIYAMLFCRDFRRQLSTVDPALTIRTIKREDGGGYAPREGLFNAILSQLPWSDAPDVAALTAHWRAHFPGCAAAVPHAADVLAALRALGVRTGVVTNGIAAAQNAKIDATGLRPLLDVIVVSETAGAAKPEPAIFRAALREVGVAPADAWFVGDHPVNDMAGATTVGMAAVWVEGHHDWPPGAPRPDASIRSVGSLPDRVRAAMAMAQP